MSTTLPLVTKRLAVGSGVDVLGRVGQELECRVGAGGLEPELLIEVSVLGEQYDHSDPARSFDGERSSRTSLCSLSTVPVVSTAIRVKLLPVRCFDMVERDRVFAHGDRCVVSAY